MSIFQAVILGLVQGIAEFLPVSSSGHLAVIQHIFKLKEIPTLFDIILHLPSLLAVCIFFRKKIIRLFAVLFRWILRKETPADNRIIEDDFLSGTEERGRKTIIAVIVTTFVTGVIGIFISRLIPELPVQAVCAGFLLTALLLLGSAFLARRKPSEKDSGAAAKKDGLSVKQAALIGLMQGVGTLPGVSRSGSTIAGALAGGVDRSAAGEYSFIVSIPTILAAFILELKDLDKIAAADVGVIQIAVACLVCFVAAYASLIWLMRLIKKGRLEWFAAYLVPLGILGLIFF